MSEGRGRDWRAWLAGLVFLGLVAGALLLAKREEPAPVASPALPREHPPVRPSVGQPPPPLGRAELIAAINQAASHSAGGEPPDRTLLAGRRFALNLPFGCAGPVPNLAEVRSGWTYDDETQTLRVKVSPEQWALEAFPQALTQGMAIEAAEGFWIERPWTSCEACPAVAVKGVAAEPARQTLAIVEIFLPDARRAARRGGRPYEAVQTIPLSAIALDDGLRLRVEGRLVARGDAPPTGCWSESPQLRPVCIVRVQFERVAITDASGARILADWKN